MRRDVQPGDTRNFTRQNRSLNPLGDFQFLLDGEQALLVGIGARGCHITEAANQDEEANGLDVAARENAEVRKIVPDHKEAKNRQSGINHF